jgi:hypothetical protein
VFARTDSRPILTEELHRVVGSFPFDMDNDGRQRHGVMAASGTTTRMNSPFQETMSIWCFEGQDGVGLFN